MTLTFADLLSIYVTAKIKITKCEILYSASYRPSRQTFHCGCTEHTAWKTEYYVTATLVIDNGYR